MFKTIVVPLDGSTLSEHALPWARAIGDRSGGALRLVRVHVPLRIPTGQEVLGARVGGALRRIGAESRSREAAYLREVGERLGDESAGPEVTTTLLQGPTVASLAREAREAGATLVVMATHARRPLDRVLLDSVADALLRQCHVPILIIPAGEDDATHPAPRLDRLLVPLDGSERAERALGGAREIARLFGAAVTLLQVVPPARNGGADPAAAGAYLEATADTLRNDGISADTRLASGGDVPGAIATTADDTGASMIVLASRCRGGLPRLVRGSIVESVLHLTPTPLLVVGTRTP